MRIRASCGSDFFNVWRALNDIAGGTVEPRKLGTGGSSAHKNRRLGGENVNLQPMLKQKSVAGELPIPIEKVDHNSFSYSSEVLRDVRVCESS